MTTIQITEVDGNDLYLKYAGQTGEQPCCVLLDCETGALTAEACTEIGNAVSFRQYYGHVQAWSIPALKSGAANGLLDRVAPLAERVCEGYVVRWNGSNMVASFTDDAHGAIEEIRGLCDAMDGDDCMLCIWDADEWYGGMGDRDQQRADLGITAETTDEELAALVAQENADAYGTAGVDGVDGVDDYLAGLRAEARKIAEEESEEEDDE